jgi:hypothetical protein
LDGLSVCRSSKNQIVTYRFVSASALASPSRSRELAAHLRQQHNFTLQGLPLCLGHLKSSDFAPLPAQRKEAVQAFWTAYFAAGANQPKSNLMEREFSPTRSVAVLAGNDSAYSGERGA